MGALTASPAGLPRNAGFRASFEDDVGLDYYTDLAVREREAMSSAVAFQQLATLQRKFVEKDVEANTWKKVSAVLAGLLVVALYILVLEGMHVQ